MIMRSIFVVIVSFIVGFFLSRAFGAEKPPTKAKAPAKTAAKVELPPGYYIMQDKANNRWRPCDSKGNCFEISESRESAIKEAMRVDKWQKEVSDAKWGKVN